MPDNRRAESFPLPVEIHPGPEPEEAAAIMAALATLSDEMQDKTSLKRSRWRLAGLLGYALEPGIVLDNSLWSYSRWKGMA
jgi:hypothetical protein